MITESEIKTVAKFIKESVEWLKKEDQGCAHYCYKGDLCIVVGWSGGYDDTEDNTLIQSKSDPTYAINAGVKLLVSAMQTDMDLDFNYLYWDNGDCWDCTTAVGPNEDYEALARELLEEAECAVDTCCIPRLRLFDRTEEHFVDTECISTVFVADNVWIYDIILRLRHLLNGCSCDELAFCVADYFCLGKLWTPSTERFNIHIEIVDEVDIYMDWIALAILFCDIGRNIFVCAAYSHCESA